MASSFNEAYYFTLKTAGGSARALAMLLRWTARFIGPLTQRWLIWIGSLAGRRALRACGAIAVVRMPLQHWLVGVGFVVSLCTWAGDVKYIPNDQLSLG